MHKYINTQANKYIDTLENAQWRKVNKYNQCGNIFKCKSYNIIVYSIVNSTKTNSENQLRRLANRLPCVNRVKTIEIMRTLKYEKKGE